MRFVKYSFVALGLLLILAAGVGVAGYSWLTKAFEAPGPLREETSLIITPGSGLATIASQLAESGVIADSRVFRVGVRLEGTAGRIKAGEYAFGPGVSPRDVMDKMVLGQVVVHSVTFPEGLTSKAIVQTIADSPLLTGEITLSPPEGSLLPNTYYIRRGDDRNAVLNRMILANTDALNGLWANRAPDLPFDTKEQALVLASIVEKETGITGERPRVAGVFVNRLRIGMPLQSDPTVIYGLSDGLGRLDRPLTRADLQNPHAWNTYVHPGLPPSPICNPGIASLRAVLDPLKTKDLYFVADGTGGHAFAETLEQHNRNVANWRRIERNARP